MIELSVGQPYPMCSHSVLRRITHMHMPSTDTRTTMLLRPAAARQGRAAVAAAGIGRRRRLLSSITINKPAAAVPSPADATTVDVEINGKSIQVPAYSTVCAFP